MNLSSSWAYVEETSAKRLAHNKTVRHISEYGEYIELIGAAGELAARRFLKLPENIHSTFDGGTDLIFEGIKIDVKATIWTSKLQYRYLQWQNDKPFSAEVILLTAVNIANKSAVVVGWATREEVKNAPVNKTRRYACHEIPIRILHKPYDLLELAEARKKERLVGDGIGEKAGWSLPLRVAA